MRGQLTRQICQQTPVWLLPLLVISQLTVIGPGVTVAVAQTASIQGIITDNENGQALVGSNVLLSDLDDEERFRGTITDGNGFYRIGNVQPGRYAVRISYIGYVTYTDTLQVGADGLVTISVPLEPDSEELGQIVVTQTGGAARLEGGLQRISVEDISRVPTPAGSGDLASYLQALPGVVTIGDRGGGLYIRGGTPAENLVLMDGTQIYQPFHIVSFFSAFPETIISSADFYAGGFGSRYNNRISSVIDIRMRNGNRLDYRGSGSISPFLGEVVVEGPIKEGVSSWIASARRSLIEETSSTILSEEYPLSFESQYFKINHAGSNDSRCSALFMRTRDSGQIDLERDESFQWGNLVFGGQCVILPEGSAFLFDANVGVSHITNTVTSGFASERFSDATRLNIDVNMSQYTGNIKFDYGLFTHLKWLNYDTRELFQDRHQDSPMMLGSGGYIDATLDLGNNAQVTPGFAFSFYRFFYKPSLEPRFRFAWQPFGDEDTELNAAVGVYRQPVAGIGDMRDAGSAFTAWMPTPIGDSQMEAVHMLLGWRQTLGSGFNISLEGYRKSLRNMAIPVWSTLATFTSDLSQADGQVYGADFRLEYDSRRVYGFIGYGFSRTEYESSQDHFGEWFGEPVQRFHPPHDRRHQINSMVSFDLGRFVANLRWQFGSGLPYTRPYGYDELFYYYDHLPDVNYEFGTPRVILDKPYQGRMPVYHRLDISVERSFSAPFGEVALQAGAINLYDQTNIFYYDVYNHRRIDQLPLAPYVSLKLEVD